MASPADVCRPHQVKAGEDVAAFRAQDQIGDEIALWLLADEDENCRCGQTGALVLLRMTTSRIGPRRESRPIRY